MNELKEIVTDLTYWTLHIDTNLQAVDTRTWINLEEITWCGKKKHSSYSPRATFICIAFLKGKLLKIREESNGCPGGAEKEGAVT